ncbi:hypothetical protein [Actinoallomurus rhizosphaericola]|uniref:hypothetical protein n=1 Tax=Actinoallomurus rhizosphaericola TaxID=2952536 RepID=UPI002093B4AA|nr:hypothetical protein [Actinoallomurus rhizosphaericola]MCO5997306.1 hypothetical protein [Actinoallomurus rhizosphaericola]
MARKTRQSALEGCRRPCCLTNARVFAGGLAPATPGEVVDAVTGLLDGFGEGPDDDTALLAVGVPRRSRAD